MQKESIYDVAIIGGGPAGSTFARELARSCPDKKIAILDGRICGGSKVCGGLLAPDAQKVLAMLDLTLPKKLLADPQIFDVCTLDLASGVLRNYQRHYLNIDRGEFDEWLMSLISDSVERITARCTNLVSCDDGLFKLTLDINGEIRELVSGCVVGADGASSVVRRRFFDLPKKTYIAIQEYFEDAGDKTVNYSCVFDPKTSDSCSWTIRKNEYFIFGGAFEREGCKAAYEKQRERLESFLGYSFGEAIKREACLVTSPRRSSDFVLGKDGVFLIGEAAGFISSSSFEGISSAMLSGKYLADSFAKGKDLKKTLGEYKRKTKKLRLKLRFKIPKMRILCSPFLRGLIMKSGIASIKKY